MNLDSIRIFLEVKNRQSITDAASALSLSQSTVSRRLAELEQELGVKLFFRGKGQSNVTLSDMGEAFIQIADKIMALCQEAQYLKFQVPRVRVSVAVLDSIYTYFLKDSIPNFVNEHPEYILTLAIQHSWEVHDLLERREANIGIANNVSPYADLVSKHLFSEDFVVIHKNFDGMRWPKCMHPRDLPSEHEIHQPFDPSYNIWHDYWWSPHSAKVHVSIASLGTQFFNAYDDWAIIPYSIAYAIEKKGFTISCLYDAPPQRDCYLILPKYTDHHIRESINVVSEMLTSQIYQCRRKHLKRLSELHQL